MTPEGQIVRAVLDYLHLAGLFAWRNATGATKSADGKRFLRYGEKGSPDIIGILPGGRFLAIECKSATGRLSQEQKTFLGRLESDGALVIVARSIEDIIEGLQGEPCGNALSALSRD